MPCHSGWQSFVFLHCLHEVRIDACQAYQSIYCQTRAADRERAKDFARELEHGANAAAESDDQPSRIGTNRGRVHGVLDLADVGALRVCNNGDVVPDDGPASGRTLLLPARPERDADASASAPRSGAGSIGPPMGIGLKDLETPEPLNGDEAAPTDDGQAPTE